MKAASSVGGAAGEACPERRESAFNAQRRLCPEGRVPSVARGRFWKYAGSERRHTG